MAGIPAELCSLRNRISCPIRCQKERLRHQEGTVCCPIKCHSWLPRHREGFQFSAMADTAVDTTTAPEITAKDLKEKKEAVEEVEEAPKENGSGDAPANGNGTTTNGASHEETSKEDKEPEEAPEGEGEEKAAEEEADGQAVKRPAEEEESVETKKQKTEENGESTEAEVKA
ncbi:hypothetical protein AOLI_G00247910 [Acnodon oligacanthus]